MNQKKKNHNYGHGDITLKQWKEIRTGDYYIQRDKIMMSEKPKWLKIQEQLNYTKYKIAQWKTKI